MITRIRPPGSKRLCQATLACAIASGLAITACGDSEERGATPDAVTWNQHIAPLVAEKCSSCHTEGGIAPFSMDTYDKAKPFAAAMATAVEQGRMPPFLAQETEDCKPRFPWLNDLRLKASEKELLRSWADTRAPEGDGQAANGLTAKLKTNLEREDVVMISPESVTVQGQKDVHTCVIVDPGLSEDSYVVGRMISAGNSAVLHHVVSYVILPGMNEDGSPRDKAQLEAALMAEKQVGVGGHYDCFGGPSLSTLGTEMLDAWAPGATPNLAPADSGQPIDKDSLVLLDLHYHPAGAGDQVDPGTKLALMLAEDKPAYVSKVALLGNFEERTDAQFGVGDLVQQPDEDSPEFVIPANAKDHVEEVTWTWKLNPGVELKVYGAGTHMHYVGRGIRVTVERAAASEGVPDQECLIETPAWDFNWQRGYGYDAPRAVLPVLRDGDTVRVRCVYDNTMDNPFVAQALAARGLDAPVDVRLGEDTLDEMCLGSIGIEYPNL